MIKDYDCNINYHPSKVNVMVDALSRKSRIYLAALGVFQPQLIMWLKRLRVEIVALGTPAFLSSMVVQLELLEKINAAQVDDPKHLKI